MELPLENIAAEADGKRYVLQTDVSTFTLFLWTTTALAVLFSPQLLYYCNLMTRF